MPKATTRKNRPSLSFGPRWWREILRLNLQLPIGYEVHPATQLANEICRLHPDLDFVTVKRLVDDLHLECYG